MKTTRPHRYRKGFTLVELLVVIAIIAVLAAMGFAGAQAAINKARKTKARKICVSMDQAVMSFYDEYGHLPTNPDGDTILDTDTDEDELLTILLGYEEDSDTMENKKGIRFFEAAEAKGGKKSAKDGIRYGEADNVEGLFDPWGETYQVVLDGDYDESIDNPFSESSSQSDILRGRRVATFTFGKNGDDDGGSRDDVKSW